MMDFSYENYIKYFCNDGFLSPQLTIDRPLYRYRSNIDYVVDEITNDHIYLAPIETLNDPFDSSFAMSFEEALGETAAMKHHLSRCYFLRSKEWFPAVEANLSPLADQELSLDSFSKLLEKEITKVGGYYPASAIAKNYYKLAISYVPKRLGYGRVACFSETWDSIPMWSYYADSHKGVCMKYDFTLLDKNDQSVKNLLASLQKVWYSQHRPFDKEGTFSPFMKGLQWAHEQEWRLFRELGSEFVSLPCMTELYLGVNFDFDKIDSIIDAVKKQPGIKIYILHPNPDTYGFYRIPLNYD